MIENPKAKVFISCGQNKDSGEVDVAIPIARTLEELGFEPYVAFQEQTLSGLRDNIFSHLSTSEYFLFVDFQREQFANSPDHRGSLFSNQELAIASYLDIEVIAFRQKGVRELDGMTRSLQLNADTFDDPWELPEMVRNKVKQVEWNAGWKNMLAISRDPNEYTDGYVNIGTNNLRQARFFHLKVENLNSRKIALGCTAYVEAATNLKQNTPIPLKTVEIKWAGYTMPSAAIMPNRSYRELDAFYVFPPGAHNLLFHCFTDSGYFMQPIQGPGDYQLTYAVISENFPIARAVTRVHIGHTLEEIKFCEEPD